jgi:hypothetical protein
MIQQWALNEDPLLEIHCEHPTRDFLRMAQSEGWKIKCTYNPVSSQTKRGRDGRGHRADLSTYLPWFLLGRMLLASLSHRPLTKVVR